MRKTTFFSFILVCCILTIFFSGCSTSEPPLHIRDISVIPQPAIGKIVTLQVEIENGYRQDFDNIVFELMPSNGIVLMDGQTSRVITIKQWQRKTLSIPICVTRVGEQQIHLWVSIPLAPDSRMTDGDILKITVLKPHSGLLPIWEYFGPPPTPAEDQISTPGPVTCE